MCEIWRRKHRTYELMMLIFFEDERGSIVKEYFENSLSWYRITLDDTTDYELQRTMSDPRRFHVLKKFSIDIVVSLKLDFVCDPRCAKIKITFTRDIESQSKIKKAIFYPSYRQSLLSLKCRAEFVLRVWIMYLDYFFIWFWKIAFYYSFVVSPYEYVSFVDVPRMHSLCDEQSEVWFVCYIGIVSLREI